MSSVLSAQIKKQAYKIWYLQLSSVFVISLLSLFWGWQAAGSVMVGGLVQLIPAWVLIQFGFRHSGARAAKKIVQGFFFGEFLKIFLTILLFVMVFKFIPVSIGFLFIGFGASLLMFWIAPVLVKRKTT
jgi:ATP synthase protein I